MANVSWHDHTADSFYHFDPIPDTPPFVSSSVHYQWCMRHERTQVRMMAAALRRRRGDCVLVDVGMNDGFYTQLAAAQGCQVYAFELQDLCIEISWEAARRNNATSRISIVHAPVSDENGRAMLVARTRHPWCDGGFSLGWKRSAVQSSAAAAGKTFHTAAMDSFVPPGIFVDVLKVDVTGRA